MIDLAVLVEAPEKVRCRRLVVREGREFMTRWHELWDEPENLYFGDHVPPAGFDIVVPDVDDGLGQRSRMTPEPEGHLRGANVPAARSDRTRLKSRVSQFDRFPLRRVTGLMESMRALCREARRVPDEAFVKAVTRLSRAGDSSGQSALAGPPDGIVLHQILPVASHAHLLLRDGTRDTTVAGLETKTFWDGLFHAATWVAVCRRHLGPSREANHGLALGNQADALSVGCMLVRLGPFQSSRGNRR